MVLVATKSSMLIARAAMRGASHSPISRPMHSTLSGSTLRHRRIGAPVNRSFRPHSSMQRAAGHDRVLLACMGFVGGGIAFTELFSNQDDSFLGKLQRTFYREEDDSVSAQVQSALRNFKRNVEAELSDDNHKVIAALIATNIAVCGLWRVSFRYPSLERFMWRHFACSYNGVVHGKRIHTILTSAFSHITVPHIAINMFMLWEFGSHIIAPKDAMDSWLNKALARSRVVDFLRSSMSTAAQPQLLPLEQFLMLYGTSALASSTLSIIASRFRGTPATFTIGASGAVMGVLTMYCLLFPERRMMLYGLFDCTATQLLQLMTAVNLIGSAFQRGLHIDFTGHLGGQLTGLALHEAATPQIP